jgi:protein-tyrosine phosphatase
MVSTNTNVKKVLVICTGNLYRSPVAAGFLKHTIVQDRLQDRIQVVSAGLDSLPGLAAPAAIVQLMAKRYGIDLSTHLSQSLTPELFQQADLVLVMEQSQLVRLAKQYPRQTSKLHLISELTGQIYDILDPATHPQQDLGVLAEQIHTLITVGLLTLLQWLKLQKQR